MSVFTPRDPSCSPDAHIHGTTQLGQITDIQDWPEVLDVYRRLKQQYAPYRLLFTLDDEGQAQYTSMHAGMQGVFYLELDDEEETDDDAIAAGEFKHHVEQLNNPNHQVGLAACSAKMSVLNDDGRQALVLINQNPCPVLDRSLSVLAGESDCEPLKLALLLNGYFQSDFNPFENLALIHLMADFGFEFMGIGASLLGFIKTDGFDPKRLPDLMDEVAAVYHLTDEYKETLMRLWQDRDYAVLPYSDSAAELLDFYQQN